MKTKPVYRSIVGVVENELGQDAVKLNDGSFLNGVLSIKDNHIEAHKQGRDYRGEVRYLMIEVLIPRDAPPAPGEFSAAKVRAHDGWHTGKPVEVEVEVTVSMDDRGALLGRFEAPRGGQIPKKGPVQLKRVIVPGNYGGLRVRLSEPDRVSLYLNIGDLNAVYLRELAGHLVEMAEVIEEE